MVLINGLRWSNTTGFCCVEGQAYMLLCNIYFTVKLIYLRQKWYVAPFFFFYTVTNYPIENGVFPDSFIYKRNYVVWQEARNCRCSKGAWCIRFGHHLVPGYVQPLTRRFLSYVELHRINIYHTFSDTSKMILCHEWKY